MKKLLFFLIIFNFIYPLEKYKESDILSVWKIEGANAELILHKEKDGLGFLNSHRRQKELWDIVSKFYPSEITNKITTFVVFADNREDNNGGMFGLIETENNENKRFILSLDIQDSYYGTYLNLESLLSLLVHEFFHIVSLSHEELSKEDTGGLKLFEGYARKSSYLNKFYEKFWVNSLGKKLELLEENPTLSPEEKRQIRKKYYEQNRDKFVHDYGMTNVVEDIAVSFEEFVRTNKEQLKSRIKDKKIIFFYSYPKLIEYKNYFLERRKELLKKQ